MRGVDRLALENIASCAFLSDFISDPGDETAGCSCHGAMAMIRLNIGKAGQRTWARQSSKSVKILMEITYLHRTPLPGRQCKEWMQEESRDHWGNSHNTPLRPTSENPKKTVASASWRSGYVADCKSVHRGSIPLLASNVFSDL